MLTITRRFGFEAAHCLPGHSGKCSSFHGHSYKLDVTVRRFSDCGKTISGGSSEGMITDFSDLKNIVNKTIIEKLDHKNLNEVYTFRPTAENMCMDIYDLLGCELTNHHLYLVSVRLWETEDSYAEVSG